MSTSNQPATTVTCSYCGQDVLVHPVDFGNAVKCACGGSVSVPWDAAEVERPSQPSETSVTTSRDVVTRLARWITTWPIAIRVTAAAGAAVVIMGLLGLTLEAIAWLNMTPEEAARLQAESEYESRLSAEIERRGHARQQREAVEAEMHRPQTDDEIRDAKWREELRSRERHPRPDSSTWADGNRDGKADYTAHCLNLGVRLFGVEGAPEAARGREKANRDARALYQDRVRGKSSEYIRGYRAAFGDDYDILDDPR